jgi:hypothetical protein
MHIFRGVKLAHLILENHHILTYRIGNGSGDLYFNLIEGRSMVSFQTFQYFPHFLKIGNNCNYFHLMCAFFTDKRIDLIHL